MRFFCFVLFYFTCVTTRISSVNLKITRISLISVHDICAGKFNVRISMPTVSLTHASACSMLMKVKRARVLCACDWSQTLVYVWVFVSVLSFQWFVLLPVSSWAEIITRLRSQMHSTRMWTGRVGTVVCVSVCVCTCVKGLGVWQEQRWSSEAFLMSQGNQCQGRWLWWMPFRKHCVTMTSAWRNLKVSKRQKWPSAGCCHEGDPLNHYLCTQVLL